MNVKQFAVPTQCFQDGSFADTDSKGKMKYTDNTVILPKGI